MTFECSFQLKLCYDSVILNWSSAVSKAEKSFTMNISDVSSGWWQVMLFIFLFFFFFWLPIDVTGQGLNYIFFFLHFPSSWSGSFYVSACLWILGTKQYVFYLWFPSLFTDCSVPLLGSHYATYVLCFYGAEPHLSLSSANKVSITRDGVLWKTHILLSFTVIPPPNYSYQVEHSSWLLTLSSPHPSDFSSTS